MTDVLTITDLEAAKKHDTFHSEVITGKAGGFASGVNIDTATNAVTGQVQTTLPKVLRDVGFKPASFNFVTGGTLGLADADKCIYNPAPAGDDNWYSFGGNLPHTVAPGADPTAVGSGYVPRTDVELRGELADDGGTDLVAGKGPESGEVIRSQSDRNQDAKTIRDFGGKDDWDGTSGTNNLAPLSMYTQFCLDNGVKEMRFPFRGTGVYQIAGTDGWVSDIPGIELVIDEGVSFVVDSGLRIFSRGVKCNRELIVRVDNATVEYDSPLSPVQFKKPSELFPGLGQGDGACEVPSTVDMTNVTGYNITGTSRSEISITKTASTITVPHSVATDRLCFAVPSKIGEEVFCYTSAGGVGVIGVLTVNKVVTVECDSGTGSTLINDNGNIQGIFKAEPTDKLRNRFNSGLMSVVVSGESTFSVLVNGVHLYTHDAKDPITAVIFGNRGNTDNVVYSGVSKIKGCKSVGSRPLRIIALGDSTSQPDIAQGSQIDYMRQFLASAGCQVQYMKNMAVGGETSAQQLARFNAEDINGYDFCIAALGVNDVQTGTAVSTFAANMGAIADKCIANNVRLIASMPTSWYPQSEAAPYGQRGQNTVNSDLAAPYRAALILKMAEKSCLISTQSIKHEGVVGAVWLDTDGADPVLMDNIHPTAYGRMMMGLGNAKSILGAINRRWIVSESAPSQIPSRWKTAFTTASSTLTVGVSIRDGSTMFTGGIEIPSVPANGTAIIKLDKELAPVGAYLYFTTPCQSGAGPIGSCTIVVAPDGNISAYNVPAGTTNIILQGVEIKRY